MSREYSTQRQSIVNSLVETLKTIDGTGNFLTNLFNNVSPRLKFWDEVQDFPSVHVQAGTETREYQGAGYKDRFLSVTIRCYVRQENAVDALEALIEDIETVVEDNSRLAFTNRQGNTNYTQQISIVNITTDEGVLEPYGVGEILIEVRY